MDDKKRKVVFVLGAGFSADARVPLQNSLLREVLRLNTKDAVLVQRFLTAFWGQARDIPLEDIFTALDRSISADHALRSYKMKDLWGVRHALIRSIANILVDHVDAKPPRYVRLFAQELLEIRMRDQKTDPIAVLSTNWDVLLDNALGDLMTAPQYERVYNSEKRRAAYIDYCISDRQLRESPKIPRSLHIKVLGFYNVKHVKLHGSLNWMVCPRCDNLFIEYGRPLAEWIKGGRENCPECMDRVPKTLIDLRPLLISPTFLKDLSGVHLRSTWWSAAIELREATDIYFIGYSLPESDFELRYFFGRNISVPPERIRVILKRDKKRPFMDKLIRERYVRFFGNDIKKNIDFEGVRGFLQRMHQELADV